MKISKLLICSIILFITLSCDKFYDSVNKKVTKETDKKIDETINKADSILIKRNIDSLKSKIDSSIERTKQKFKQRY